MHNCIGFVDNRMSADLDVLVTIINVRLALRDSQALYGILLHTLENYPIRERGSRLTARSEKRDKSGSSGDGKWGIVRTEEEAQPLTKEE